MTLILKRNHGQCCYYAVAASGTTIVVPTSLNTSFGTIRFGFFSNLNSWTKCAIIAYNRCIIIDPKTTIGETTDDNRASIKQKHSDTRSTLAITTYVPSTVLVSNLYWRARLLDVLAMSQGLDKPKFFCYADDKRQFPRTTNVYGEALAIWNEQ